MMVIMNVWSLCYCSIHNGQIWWLNKFRSVRLSQINSSIFFFRHSIHLGIALPNFSDLSDYASLHDFAIQFILCTFTNYNTCLWPLSTKWHKHNDYNVKWTKKEMHRNFSSSCKSTHWDLLSYWNLSYSRSLAVW